MRLLHTATFEFREVPRPSDDICYAILSHTWSDDEVNFQEFSEGSCSSKAGYVKVIRCCELAKRDGLDYVWIDTCCIDKKSSSELSEAINSMYKWYKGATVCYAYLSDVRCGNGDHSEIIEGSTVDNCLFEKSRWFTRGWTLQELVAPEEVIFYDCNWVELGTKYSLQQEITKITRIPRELLVSGGEASLGQFCIAQRLSWAANRETTREEDIAYCLMGIFDVNMPIIYGEGDKAFIRLQHEIMKGSDDQSLFAWLRFFSVQDDLLQHIRAPDYSDESNRYKEYDLTSVLATDPSVFKHGGWIKRSAPTQSKLKSYSVTNKGLNISLPLVEIGRCSSQHNATKHSMEPAIFLAVLNCELIEAPSRGPLGIYLGRQSSSGRYRRISSTFLGSSSMVPGIGAPTVCDIYLDIFESNVFAPLLKGDPLDNSPSMDTTLVLVNCSVVDYKQSQGGLFALKVKSSRADADQAIVMLFRPSDIVSRTMASKIYLPSDLPGHTADLDLNEWIVSFLFRRHPEYSNRARRRFRTGDEITVAIRPRPGKEPSTCVLITCLSKDQDSSQKGSVLLAYEQMQKGHPNRWSGGVIYSKEIEDLENQSSGF